MASSKLLPSRVPAALCVLVAVAAAGIWSLLMKFPDLLTSPSGLPAVEAIQDILRYYSQSSKPFVMGYHRTYVMPFPPEIADRWMQFIHRSKSGPDGLGPPSTSDDLVTEYREQSFSRQEASVVLETARSSYARPEQIGRLAMKLDLELTFSSSCSFRTSTPCRSSRRMPLS